MPTPPKKRQPGTWLRPNYTMTLQLTEPRLNGHGKVAIINAVVIPRWAYRALFPGNRSRMALWDDILLQYLRDTLGLEQRMNKYRLTTDVCHGGLGLCQVWWSYITRWITLGQQELQNNGPTRHLTTTQ